MLAKKHLGSYRILGRISSGGMGDVYLGEDIRLKRRVAIKALKQEFISDSNVIERFNLEAITLAKLSHPNVITLYAFLEEDDNYYLVVEFISGWALNTFIEQAGALPLSVSLYLYKQILAGISAIHAKGIVHRDLKPSNIMITEDLIVKVMDFGIARFQTDTRLTRHGKLIGTIEYMSPEQILGKDATVASDIYSLGVLLFEMVTGRAPFSGDSEYEVMRSQVEKPPPSPLEFKADIPQKLVDILSRALAKNPDERYLTAEAFTKALDETDIDTSNAILKLHEFIRAHRLEQEKTLYHISPIDHESSQELILTHQFTNNSKKQNFIYIKNIYSRFISILGQRLWLGPLILLISFAIVSGLMLKRNLLESVNKSVSEEMDKNFTDSNVREDIIIKDSFSKVREEIIIKDSFNNTDSREISHAFTTDRDVSSIVDLILKDINEEVPSNQIEPLPFTPIQPPKPSRSAVDLTVGQPSSTSTLPFLQRLPMTTDIGTAVEQKIKPEKLPIATQEEIRPKTTDEPRRESSEWIIHK